MLKPHPAYGLDLPKNNTEIYGTDGTIKTAYTYTPYGQVTANGSVTQPLQWSSEYADTDLALVYYNYRHYNPLDGRWTGRDIIGEVGAYNIMSYRYGESDILGLLSTNSISATVEQAIMRGDVRALRDLLELAKLAGNAALAKTIESALEKIEEKKEDQDCNPCVPPKGTKLCLKALPCTRVTGAHKDDKIGHIKVWKVHQDPNCRCHINFVGTLEKTLELPPDCLEISTYPDHNTVQGGGKL